MEGKEGKERKERKRATTNHPKIDPRMIVTANEG